MEWFHFSDFHIGRPKGPQSNAMASLIEAVERAASEHVVNKVDAVFITGDIAYSGKSEEYDKFQHDFLSPLKEINVFSDAVVYAVPGNHDIDCDATLPISWETIGVRNQKIFFSENEEGVRIRIQRATAFNAYWTFVQKNGIISPNPNQEVSVIRREESYPFDIIATNTAFFSDHENDSSGETTPSPIESLNHRLSLRTKNKPIVILAHHPQKCFLSSQQSQLSTLLRDKKAVLLHGHEHIPHVSFNRDGTILTFGFGASYLASHSEQTVAPYQNTFTHCKLDTNLQIRAYSWQFNIGKWINTTGMQLPECLPENDLDSKVGQVYFPSYITSTETIDERVSLQSVQRAAPKPSQLILMESPGDSIINRLFQVSANLRNIFQKGDPQISKNKYDDGKIRFEIESNNGQRHLLLFIYAINHVLSSKEVETLNTELDTEDFYSATVISIGKISNSAQTMYLRLQDRKKIEIIGNEEIALETNSLLTDAQRAAISRLDAANHSVCLLVGKEELYLLTIDQKNQQNKFHIIAEDGNILSPSDPAVAILRRGNPEFTSMLYNGETAVSGEEEVNRFEENIYLEQCHKEYNVMKYAALANVGIRFSDLPLENLYISASASDVSDTTATRHEQFVGDHLETCQFSDELREHIQEKLLSDVNQSERQETSRALEFCQKYSAVLITGDPGSGKTCFVKNEILAYCKKAFTSPTTDDERSADWHSIHLPIMVSLSEVAAEKDLEDNGLLVIVSRLCERRGLHIGADDIYNLTLQGRLAFFFDGLDEVVSIEKRAQIVKHINDLVVNHLPTGNRIVVTSRPAAVQVVNLMPSLHKLELQGLTQAEIRKLAGRLLALEISATTNDVLVGEGKLDQTDHIVISQLLSDCERNPGVSRMAQNPLLLTLLIMIYANSGAPSAKRHRIYEEAIKTLASVRGREAGHQPISVQDLRERLGAVALSVYKKESGILPVRSEVSDVIKKVMVRQLGEKVSNADANSFIQRVAESTGLIALDERQGEDDENAIVTFMHHSFLEYFAAVGLSRELDQIDLGALVNEPRWREILTLLSGIIGESKDVSPIINRFLESGSTEHDVDAKLLLFAIDCALECEVPSESAQRLLSSGIKLCLESGPGRLDSWVRSEIGKRLAQVVDVCGGSEFDGMLAKLIQDGDEAVSSAAIDVAGHAYANGHESNEILSAFEKACSRIEGAVLSAICGAASNSSVLRTDASEQVIAKCLSKSKRTRQAAYQALAKIPSLSSKYWDEIINGIDDKDTRTSRFASIAAMHAGLNIDVISLTGVKKDILIRALDNVAAFSNPNEYRSLEVKKDTINQLLESANRRDRILAIRLLPFSEGEEKYVYKTLIDLIKGTPPREELVAALIALRWSGRVIALVKLSDLKAVAHWLKEGTSDTRTAATHLLGYFNKDRVAIEALISEDFSKLDLGDYCDRISALSQAKVERTRVRELFFKELSTYLTEKKVSSKNQKRVEALLDATRKLGGNAPQNLVNKIRRLIDDYKADMELRKKALLCLPAIVEPSEKTIKKITKIFETSRPEFEQELVQIPSILAKNCRSSVDYVVASVSALSKLRVVLLELHCKYSKRMISENNEICVTELRSGIDDLTQIIVAFKDFIGDGSADGQSVNMDLVELN